MFPEARTLLCIEPTATQQALIRQIANRHGLGFAACRGEEDAVRHLDGDGRYTVMVIAHQLKDGDSYRVIEGARLSLNHATLPIAFIMTDRDLRLAQNAMIAGATEVFLRSEYGALTDFVGHWSLAVDGADYGGRVLLVEDSDSQAQYIEHLCRALGMGVDRAADVDSALGLFRRHEYQMVVVDVVLNDTRSGISLVKHIRQDHTKRQPVLVMSGFDDLPRRFMALRSGADDFLSKPFSPEEFVWRVKKVMQGYAGNDFGDLEPAGQPAQESSPDFVALLSPREREIFDKILAGVSDKDIAQDLGISFWTVRSHIQRIYTKTGVLNRRELMARFLSGRGQTA